MREKKSRKSKKASPKLSYLGKSAICFGNVRDRGTGATFDTDISPACCRDHSQVLDG
jgi:hypothetical protein